MKLQHLGNTIGSGQLPQWNPFSFWLATSLVRSGKKKMNTWSLGTQFHNQPSQCPKSMTVSFHQGRWSSVSPKFSGAAPVQSFVVAEFPQFIIKCCLNLLSFSYIYGFTRLVGKLVAKRIEKRRQEKCLETKIDTMDSCE